MGERGGRNWWLIGCFALAGAILLVFVVVAGLTLLAMRSDDPRHDVVVQDSPPPAPGLDVTPVGRVVLELDSAQTFVEPAAPGEPLTVNASYDAHAYRLEDGLDEGPPWTYRLRFVVTGSRLITGIKEALRGDQPLLHVRLPTDVPLELRLVQRNGAAAVDLSGLQLGTAEFDVEGGLLSVDADAPLRGQLRRFAARGGRGALTVDSFSLMRPAKVDVDFRFGEVRLDFRGHWTDDATVDLSTSLADVTLRLPRETRVEGLETTRSPVPVAPEVDPATLRFSVEPGTRTELRVLE